MKKYISFFSLRFNMGLQYRAAALAGMTTQFVWGFMECFVYRAFYESDPEAFPMTFSAMAAYIWLQQAFLAFFGAWMFEMEIFDSIRNGNIAYELCRPISIYDMWFSRSVATRLSRAVLRCFPILIVALLLPEPYRLHLPGSPVTWFWFLMTITMGLLMMVSYCMLVYVLAFFTVSPDGLRTLMALGIDFFTGAVVPLPFLPKAVRRILEVLPFAGMQNVPLRIFSGDLAGNEMNRAIFMQVFWLLVLIALGKGLCRRAERRIVVQGG